MRLIDADELWEKAKVRVEDNGGLSLPNLYWTIKGLPTIDAEPVVRCKDCKHYRQSVVADRKMCFRKDVDGIEVCYDFLPNDSCTYGERKDEVTE